MNRHSPSALEISRRRALQLFAATAAAGLGGCGRAPDEIVPYVELPDGLTPGEPLSFATAVSLAGYAQGVLATTYEGRPTRLDGNPRHSASLGAIDIFAQAAIMSLYEPDRAKSVRHNDRVSTWAAFETALHVHMSREHDRGGAGLRIVTGTVTSPTLLRQLQDLRAAFPQAQWTRYEPVNDDAAQAGAQLAFGRRLIAVPRFHDASVVLTLDADPLGPGPMQVRNATSWSRARQASLAPDRFLRLYAVESMRRLTGANADERLPLAPTQVGSLALAVANKLGASLGAPALDERTRKFAEAAATDLIANKSRAIVLSGETQPPEVHALAHWINGQLQAPIDYSEPVDASPQSHGESLKQLADDLRGGKVETLIILDGNLAYSAPGDLKLAELMSTVPFSAHLGRYDTETAAACQWQLPMTHVLESWSDLRAFDGTASVVQPLIRPLYDTRDAHQLIALLLGRAINSYDVVRVTWQGLKQHSDFDSAWRSWLHAGAIPDTAQPAIAPPEPKLPQVAPAEPHAGFTLVTAPDPTLWDGCMANNPWLQECPKPLTTEVWGNSLKISPNDAAKLTVQDGDIVRIASGSISVEAPVMIQSGQPDGVVAATLGYGHTRMGEVANGLGFNTNPLRTFDSPWIGAVTLQRTGKRRDILRTQHAFDLSEHDRESLFQTRSLGDLANAAASVSGDKLPSLLPEWRYPDYKWAMVIDTSVCIGCQSCVVACQSENNVPVVGPDEIAVGRVMHWLRVDTYFPHGEEKPAGFQPVPCMHCEHAPCEPVCPVAASVHDGQGLNLQVYNRCIGTRFCQSNCPYKVRRFNWFGYAQDQAPFNLSEPVTHARYNPDVTVRTRGVMEKCTYCIQRIERARRQADITDERIADGAVVTACQSACPTRAIAFGDLNAENSAVNKARRQPHHYAMLEHLGTRPRTTYLARIENPSDMLRDESA